MHLRHLKTCRVCGSASLTMVIALGAKFLQGAFIKGALPSPPLRRITLKLDRSDPTRDESACGFLQMGHSVPPDVLFLSGSLLNPTRKNSA